MDRDDSSPGNHDKIAEWRMSHTTVDNSNQVHILNGRDGIK